MLCEVQLSNHTSIIALSVPKIVSTPTPMLTTKRALRTPEKVVLLCDNSLYQNPININRPALEAYKHFLLLNICGPTSIFFLTL